MATAQKKVGLDLTLGLSILFAPVLGMGVMGYFWAIGFSRALPALICFIFFISGRRPARALNHPVGKE